MTKQKPVVGQLTTIYGVDCRIVKIHPFGTMDVVSLDGSKSWRVTGLGFL